MNVFLRFLRQLTTVIVIIVGVVVMMVAGFVFYDFYWLNDKMGTDNRTYALREAVGTYSPRLNSSECRWWFLESCRAFALPPEVLHNSEKLGKAMEAVLYPCRYLTTPDMKKRYAPQFDKECSNNNHLSHTPIILIFDDGYRKVRIRID